MDDGAVWALLDAAPDGMFVVDRRGRMVFANSQAETLFGYPYANYTTSTLYKAFIVQCTCCLLAVSEEPPGWTRPWQTATATSYPPREGSCRLGAVWLVR